jgi:hypothetical protein
MAEIKNTIDMVMERAARMAAGSSTENDNEEHVKAGMRLAAEYLNQPATDLVVTLAEKPAEIQGCLRHGMVQTLLRNVVLPRDTSLKERSSLALKGILALLQKTGGAAVTSTCAELQQILDQYNQHKEQATKQLEEAILNQLEQQYAARGTRPGKLTPTMHPKYHEELARMLGDINTQYNQAMDQRKETVSRQLEPLA